METGKMATGKMANEMINFQKTLFDNSYSAMNMVLEQTEQMTHNFINQAPGVPENTKKTFEDSVNFYKKAREDFKKAADQGFEKMTGMFEGK